MDVPAKDKFLNCVMCRVGMDITINPLILLLIVPGSLSFLLYLVYLIHKAWGIWLSVSDAGEYLISLFLSMDISFIAYILMTSLALHIERVIVWVDSLTDYAVDNGKDASELRVLANDMALQRIRRGRLLAFAIFVGIVSMMVLSFFIWDFTSSTDVINPFEIPERAILLLAVADLCAVSLFGLFKVYRVDGIQCRFTEIFVGAMGDDKLSEPMVSNIGKNKLAVQIVLVLMAVILFLILNQVMNYIEGSMGIKPLHIPQITMIIGLYFTLLFFYVIHIQNKHIRTVGKYEDSLIKWMAGREGAKRIVAIQTESKGEIDPWISWLKRVSWLYTIIKWLKKLSNFGGI